MLSQLPVLQKFVRQLQKIPYVASKNVYRVALYFLTCESSSVDLFCKTLSDARNSLKYCKVCNNWVENSDLCTVCSSEKRDKNIICVVETWYDLIAIESAGGYLGVYHVLGGALSPLEGIGPEQLAVSSLLKRVEAGTSEIIFATNHTPEGQATASYIYTKIRKYSIKASQLASGVPIGSCIEQMDRVTIAKALLGRQPF